MSDLNVVDLFAAFNTDTKAEQEGMLTVLPNCGDTKFRVARAGNKSYNKLLSSLYKRNRVILDSKGDDAENKSNEIMTEVFAKTILLGWEGTITYQGKKEPYSYEMAKKLLAHKDFRQVVAQVSEDFANFKTEKDEEDLGN